MAKPTITPELIARFKAYHERNPAWGALHIVMEDGNVNDGDVDFCLEDAKKKGDTEGEALALILKGMSKTQRGSKKLHDGAYVRHPVTLPPAPFVQRPSDLA